MKIERITAGNATILTLVGELDTNNLPGVSEKLDALIQKGVRHLVFNLRLLQFSKSALGCFIKTAKRLKELDGDLVLSEPSSSFQSTIKAFGIDQIFRIYPNDQEAVKYFHDRPGG
ncbi:MAG: STAS domain-containing protein [Planctomycetota bacterium]|jgi:anti-sigma B factor antagonist